MVAKELKRNKGKRNTRSGDNSRNENQTGIWKTLWGNECKTQVEPLYMEMPKRNPTYKCSNQDQNKKRRTNVQMLWQPSRNIGTHAFLL